MGSGKSTLARRLSDFTGLQFVDMDHYIEKRNYIIYSKYIITYLKEK